MFRRADTPTRFSVADLANVTRGASRTVTHKGSDNADSNYLSSASFAYDPYESGLKSTQQLKVDWSKFENHTFFNSAAAKVNVAFDRIINNYPFDGTKKELEKFLDVLTGYEKWVLDSFPRNVGYLNFSQSYLTVNDHQGSVLPDLAKNKSGDTVIDPKDGPCTVEFYLSTPSEAAGVEVVVQKKHATQNVGFCAYIKSGSAASAEVAWAVFSGSKSLVASASVPRGAFVHIAGVYDRDDSATLRLYVNGDLSTTSSNSYVFDSIDTSGAAMLVGTGSAFTLGSTAVTPDKTLYGSLDELRVFTTARNSEQVKKFRSRNIFSQEGLALYYKFNEPTGSLTGDETSRTNTIVLDSSGNGLHSYVTNFRFSLRSTGSAVPPLSNERDELNPVIFPGFAAVQTLNTNLLASGSRYDQDNPNLITRLVPKHYLTDGQDHHGLTTEEGGLVDGYDGDSIPGSGVLGSTQLLLALLYSWAKYFDELKLFVDSFAKLHYVDYDEHETSPDIFLPYALREFGIKMPNLFSDSAFAQYKDGEDVEASYSLNETSLYSVQNQIMRRVLTNMGEIVRSKGTLHSIETFFRSIGIDPNNSFKIKERGGPTRRDLSSAREKHMSPMLFLNFSGNALVTSAYMSSSRVEVGSPPIAGAFVQKSLTNPHGVSNQPKDGLWTSGSWTYEGLYRWPIAGSSNRVSTQSLARMHVTGTSAGSERLVLNLLAVSGSDPKLVLYARPGSGGTIASSPLLALTASVDVFDGDPWYISFGRRRGDLSGSNSVSSSYFINVVKQNFGDVVTEVTASALFLELTGSNTSVWENTTTTNANGAFVRIGSASIANQTGFLSTQTLVSRGARETSFDGQVAYLRFYSKGLEPAEWREHGRNPTSAGVKNPHVNYNFNPRVSGSWERLRSDVTVQQQSMSASAGGALSLFDYSQNGQHYAGTGFAASQRVIKPVVHGYSYISPNIDEAVTSEKVRVRSYDDVEKIKRTPWASSTPAYEVPKNEEPQDDPRLSIEFSLVDALNRDMITMFATLDELDLALGGSENDFSTNYPNLEHLKEVYFNRLTGKLNFRAFFDFFRWFDSSVAYFVEHLVPRKTVYYGTNFVVESHLLERHKKQYFHYDMYLSEADKPRIEDRILLQQVAGVAKRY
jgi:hypothetical protein